MTYVNSGAYNNSFIHRSVPAFIFQGGGYDVVNNQITAIPANAPVVGEHVLSNIRGTLAMALSTGPNSGTNQWFFNEIDNSALLDGTSDGGPFTAFGTVANAASLAVMDLVSKVPVPNPSPFSAPFNQIPLINYTEGNEVTLSNLVTVNSITQLTQTFAAWQAAYFTKTELSNVNYSGPGATPQNDGVPNLLKYLYDIDPARPMNATDRTALPVLEETTISGKPTLTLTYRQYALKTGITVNVQTSTNLRTWTTLASPTIVQTGNDATTTEGDPIRQVQIPATGTALFIRLNVTQP
jgi:cyclophilin family peptidyl-prolyl cis-trans isomerase